MAEDLETRYQVSSSLTLPDTSDMNQGLEFGAPVSPLLQVSTDLGRPAQYYYTLSGNHY